MRARILFAALVTTVAACIAATWSAYRIDGPELNRRAWEATYTERGLPVPPGSPVGVHWGVSWERGDALQRGGDAGPRILVGGASVAWGYFASAPEQSWWRLVARDLPARITVAALPGRTTREELARLREVDAGEPYDLVLWMTGANDLTHHPELEISERLARFDASIAEARAAFERRLFVVRQPSTLSKPLSRYERRIVELAGGRDVEALRAAERAQGVVCDVDLRDAFGGETATTFADWWHFGDAGHEIVARAIVRAVTIRANVAVGREREAA